MTETERLDAVRAWLRYRRPNAGEIDLDLDLIDNRLVSSLSFTEFLIFLESLVGHEIALEPSTIAAFRTLRGIRDIVFREARL
jgi:acyl carrier protein